MIFPPENHFIGFDEGLSNSNPLSRRRLMKSSSHKEHYSPANEVQEVPTNRENSQWKRIILLIVAITVHNIPGKFSNDQLEECLTCFGSESQRFCVCQQKIMNNKLYRMVTLPFFCCMKLNFVSDTEGTQVRCEFTISCTKPNGIKVWNFFYVCFLSDLIFSVPLCQVDIIY